MRPVPLLEGVSSTEIRRHLHAGEVGEAARLLGRPPSSTGSSSAATSGAARSGTRRPTWLSIRACSCLGTGSTPARPQSSGEHRAAVSIGTNPHYGGEERRIEPYLLDFEGDLYGRRLVVELWERLRDEQVFGSEQELVEQIARDVEATRKAVRPDVGRLDA